MSAEHRLLIDEPPLQVIPALAAVVGLNEAIILQQLHYWARRSTQTHEGHLWVYNTLGQWRAQFPFWSEDTIKRTFRRLREQGLVVVAQLAPDTRNRTNWYRIDYDALGAISPGHEGRLPGLNMGAESAPPGGQSALLLTVTPETTTETTDRENGSRSTTEPLGFVEWLEHHCEVTGQRAPGATTKARAELARKFGVLTGEGRSLEDMKLASVGAHADKWRRDNAKDFPRNVLVSEQIDELIEKGRRAKPTQAGKRFVRTGPRREF